ncbi:MAG: SH3 domain-containing protein, partial [Hydrogenimonas sp.]|nr:SH3 domain-containing protein [Hydrogenimonas sp.]
MRLHLYIAALALLLGGCAQKITKEPKTLENLSHFAVQTLPLAPKEASRAYNRFLSKRYMPWQIDKINASMEEIRWGERFILKNKIFSFNRKPLKRGELNRVIVNSNYGSINILRKRAITIYPSNLRLFPSSKPLFLDPSMPGEGYPFDYNQNSAIKAMTPLFVSHLSLDGGWAFVQTPFALGWLPIRDIAYLDKSETLKIMGLENVVIVSDNTPIYDAKQNFLFYAKIGSIFPAVGEQKGFYEILIPKKAEDRALFQKSLIPASKAKRMPLDMSKENIFAVAEELLGEPYGWGGVAGGRDCSAMTRDFFAPFGIWLPRNSAKQAKEGEVVELSGLSDKE